MKISDYGFEVIGDEYRVYRKTDGTWTELTPLATQPQPTKAIMEPKPSGEVEQEPSRAAIEAAIKAYYGDEPAGPKELSYWSDMLRAAYTIDFTALRSELQAAREEVKALSWAGQQTDALAALASENGRLTEQLQAAQAKLREEYKSVSKLEAQLAAATERLSALAELTELSAEDQKKVIDITDSGFKAQLSAAQEQVRDKDAEIERLKEPRHKFGEIGFEIIGDDYRVYRKNEGTWTELIPLVSEQLAASQREKGALWEITTKREAHLNEAIAASQREVERLRDFLMTFHVGKPIEVGEAIDDAIMVIRHLNSGTLQAENATLRDQINRKFRGISWEGTPPGEIFIQMGKERMALQSALDEAKGLLKQWRIKWESAHFRDKFCEVTDDFISGD